MLRTVALPAIVGAFALAQPAIACTFGDRDPQSVAAAQTRITLLGTGGGPVAKRSRSQPATLLQVGVKSYLIDAGDGVLRQLAFAGLKPDAIDAVFLTHMHFDHTAGLPAFMALDWVGRRNDTVSVYGPPGTEKFVRDAVNLFQGGADLFHLQQPRLPRLSSLFEAHDIAITGPSEVYCDGTIRIVAVANSHYSTMQLTEHEYGFDRSYSYRIETGDRVIVFTGDSGPSPALEELARDADILVSEVIDLPAIINLLRMRSEATGVDQTEQIDHMIKEHLTPEEVGKLASRAGVKLVVLSHFAEPADDDAERPKFLEAVRKHFHGQVVAGRDLDTF